MTTIVRGVPADIREGDVLLQRWTGWRSRVVALFNGGYSHVAIVVSLGGSLCVVEATARSWKSRTGPALPPGVNSRPLDGAFESQWCKRLAVARPRPAVNTQELAQLKIFLVEALKRQAATGHSLYDGGADLICAVCGCCAVTAERHTCTELVARALAAADRWPTGVTLAPTIGTLVRAIGADGRGGVRHVF